MRWLCLALSLLIASPVVAQDDDAGFLEGLIEGALSGDDRDVVIRGFSGALAGQSTIESLTISDADGVWLEVRDVVLDWSRLALLRRRLEVNALTVGEVNFPRAPLPANTAPTAEASSEPFAIPELPVVVNVGEVSIETIDIGEDVFGYALVASASGSATLRDGEGQANLELDRTDGPLGRFAVNGDFANETQVLGISLSVDEDAGGVIATLAGLPDTPSLSLSVEGRSPITNYIATISLETDGEPRLTGQVETALNGPADEVPRTFAASLGGDVTPLFLPEYQDFFGPAVLLALRGQADPSGAVSLDAFALEAQSLALFGQVALAPGFLPQTINISGRIEDTGGDPVLLPVSGARVSVDEVDLAVTFDASAGDAWTAQFSVAGLSSDQASADAIVLEGGGIIQGLQPDETRAVTADFDLSAQAVDLGDDAVNDVISDEVTGRLSLAWTDGAPLTIDELSIDGGLYSLSASAELQDLGPQVSAEFQSTANASDLAAFSGIAGRDLQGEIALDASGTVAPATGKFDVQATVRGEDLVVDQTQADALLDGTLSVDLVARRDETGISIDTADVSTPHLSAALSGSIASAGGALQASVDLDDVARVLPEVSGAASVNLTATQGAEGWDIDLDGQGAGVDLTAQGTVADVLSAPSGDADITLTVADLGPFGDLANRELEGSVDLVAQGSVSPGATQFDVTAKLTGQDLVIDQDQANAVVDGSLDVDLVARRDQDGITIEKADIVTPHLDAEISGTVRDTDSALSGTLRLDDVALVLTDVSGPAELEMTATQNSDGWDFSVDGDGAGVDLTASGQASDVLSAPAVSANVTLDVADIEPFGVFAGRELDGGVSVAGDVSADVSARTGSVDMTGTLQDIVLGIDQADALLAGQTQLALSGTFAPGDYALETLSARNSGFTVDGSGTISGDLTSADGSLTLTANVPDMAVIDDRVEGAASLKADLSAKSGDWTYDLDASAPLLSLASQGTIADLDETAQIDGSLTFNAQDLSRYAGLAGVAISGQASADSTFSARQDLSALDVDMTATGDSLSIGQSDVDQLLAGPFNVALNVEKTGETIDITTVNLDFAQFDITASGQLSGDSGEIDIDASLANLGLFLSNVPGAASLTGTLRQVGGERLELEASGTGPDGIALTASGGMASDFSALDLSVSGGAPLGLVNRFISPITGAGNIAFDVAVNGPPALSSVSGSLTLGNGTIVVPQVPLVMENLSAEVALGGSQANLTLQTGLRDGGRISVTGPIDLSAPFNGAIAVRLDGATLTDSSLYKTVLNGDIAVNGPLTGGATISGAIAVGETQIRLDGAGGGVSDLPPVDHRNLPANVRVTLERAGLLNEDGSDPGSDGGSAVAYPLDVSVTAPFVEVRGLGVNATLGGGLSVGGTTADVVPSGEISLQRGTLDLFGRRLILTEADITLAGSLEPFVNIVATNDRRSSDDAEAFAIIRGPISDPEITFESNPQLPQDEVLARLLFGTSIDNISPLQAAQIAATVSGGGNLLGGLQSGLGLDDLNVSTDDEGQTALTAGTYLTDTIYADVTSRSDGETEFRLNLDLTDSITVTGKSDNRGESGVGIFFRRDY